MTTAGDPVSALAGEIAAALDRLRRNQPLVQNITNYVSMDIAVSGALVINIGTLSTSWVEGMVLAAAAARAKNVPWVLDPVGVGATRFRNEMVARLMEEGPSVVRGNASEILAVAGIMGIAASDSRPKGVDSTNSTDEAAAVAETLARKSGAVVVATGAIDVVTDGSQTLRLANGSPLMARVTAIGCSLSGIVGAFLATTPDRFAATTAAVAVTGIAGERAAKTTSLPGSFRVAFIDELAAVDEQAVRDMLRLAAP